MSWTLGLGLGLTKPIAESGFLSSALNAGQRTLGDQAVLDKLSKVAGAGSFLEKLGMKTRVSDDSGNISFGSVLKGIGGAVGGAKMIAEEASKGLSKLEKVPVIGAVASGLEAPLKEVSAVLGQVESIGEEVTNFAEKGNKTGTNVAEKESKVATDSHSK
jgi:hypothetical protein